MRAGGREPVLAAVASAMAVGLGVAAARRLRDSLLLVTVEGWSMYPSFRDGDRVLVRRTRRVRRGAAAVFRAPWPAGGGGGGAHEDGGRGGREGGEGEDGEDAGGNIVKRVVALPGDRVPEALRAATGAVRGGSVPPGRVLLLGESAVSWDSRQHGYFALEHLVGVVVLVLARSGAEPPWAND